MAWFRCTGLSALVVVGVLLNACGGAPQPSAAVQTVVVERTVIVEAAPAGTSAATSQPAPSDAPQHLRVAIASDSGPLNPHDYGSSFVALDMVYEPLVRYQADGTIIPWLAESYDISSDGLTWTFRLREGVTFHDGSPFDAAAVKWNLERWVQQERHSWLPITMRIQSITTPDPRTVVLTMNEFYYAALQEFALVRPVRFLSPQAVAADGSFEQASGTGPWRLEAYTPEQRAVLRPFDGYWGTRPALTEVSFEVIPDPQTRIAALLSGEVDLIGGEYIGGISLESLPVLQRNPAVQVLTAAGTTSYFMQTNYTRPPFDDLRVRQALNHAIDRQAISQRLFGGIAAPAQGVFPETVPYVRHTESDLYRYDPERARQLLTAAGYTLGSDGMLAKDGQPLTMRLVVDGAVFPQAKAMAEVIQAQFKDVGVALELSVRDYSGWLEAFEQQDYDLLMHISWGAPYDPHSSLAGQFSTTSGSTTAFTSPELDDLIARALAEKDETARQQTFDQIWRYLDDNAAVVPIVYSNRVYALRSAVTGFTLAGTEYELDLQGVRISAP